MKEQEEEKYQRVGTTLYKIVKRPLMSGDFIEERIPWNYDTLRQDHSKDFISHIEKYDGFCSVPDHINYKQSIAKFLNLYKPINYHAIEGDCPKIIEFLSHIFGEQIEMGLDYLQLLYLKPLVRLPILLLVSKERNTGKTTFLNFLKVIFGNNMTFNTNEDFRSQFNSDWTNKLIIAVDEALLDRKEDSERIKNLSTAISFKAEAKGKDRKEVDFFAKFILNSNNENRPVIIEQGETRYWVRKISTLKKENTRILNELKGEIPHFLHFLQQREYSTKCESRMWFRHDLLVTDALRKIIQFNRGNVEIEMLNLISEIMQIKELETYSFCVNDMLDMLNHLTIKAEPTQIRRILQENWGVMPENATRYTAYIFGGSSDILEIKKTARIYRIARKNVDELMLHF
jgi:Predicted ATPase